MKYNITEKINESTFIAEKNGTLYILKKISVEEKELYNKLFDICNKNIVQVIEYYANEDGLFIVEEYVKGTTIKNYIDKGLRFNEEDVINIIIQLCNGLSEVHKAGIIHRDITASNVILTENETAKIIDFGISRIVKEQANKDTTMFGTQGFAAPEQYGFQQTDAQTDIFALGILMNFMLTGGKLPDEERYTGKLQKIIEKCTKIDPKQRYKSVNELSKNLHSLIKSKEIKMIQRQRLIIAALCSLLIISVVAIGISSKNNTEIQTDSNTPIETIKEDEKDTKTNNITHDKNETQASTDDYIIEDTIIKKWNEFDNNNIQVIIPIKNTGDKNLVLRNDPSITLEDKNGNLIKVMDMISCIPRVIQPGETGYYSCGDLIDKEYMTKQLKAVVVPHIEYIDNCYRFEISQTKFDTAEYSDEITLSGKINNTTDINYTDVYVSYIAFDKNGNLLGIGDSILSNTVQKNSSIGFKIQPLFSCPFNIDEIDKYYVYAYDWNV